jgi:hypothetical protein
MFRIAGALLAVSALMLAACADDNDEGDADPATPESSPVATSTATASPEGTSADPTPTGTELPNPADELVEEAAPIVSAEVVALESAPPQYVARVVSAQPDGCYKFARFEVEQDGAMISVNVLNTRPADLTVVLCLAQYSETTSDIPLGDLESGTEYTLSVNGEMQTFVAQ